MNLVIDASSVINLDNAHALPLVAGLERCRLCVSPLVVGECEITCAEQIAQLADAGNIEFVEHESIPAELYLQLLAEHDLGEGETECIALCMVEPYQFCCDDQKARRVAVTRIGKERVVGSLRLLRWCVNEGLATAEGACNIYQLMRDSGGFLPDIAPDWFSGVD